jgi:hypothetical protein
MNVSDSIFIPELLIDNTLDCPEAIVSVSLPSDSMDSLVVDVVPARKIVIL